MPDNGWHFSVEVDGEDLVVRNTIATWFGGSNDPEDNGETSSGVNTKDHPDILGCALPVVPTHPSTAGSPLAFTPRIPWFTRVEVEAENGKRVNVTLLDNGPAKSAGNGTRGIDLTQAAFTTLGGSYADGMIRVSYRVIGGAKFLEDYPTTQGGRCVS